MSLGGLTLRPSPPKEDMKPLVLLLLATAALNNALADGILTVDAPGHTTQNAEYTTSHVYIDEIVGDTRDITFTFDPPGSGAVDRAEIFTNLNRRDLARTDKNNDGIADGIVPIDGGSITSSAADADPITGHYYTAFAMNFNAGTGTYELTIPAAKTGAYRATARYRTSPGGAWIWYGLRDHCIVVSPVAARDIALYEINVFNIEADGDSFADRSTLEDLHNAPGAPHSSNNRWDLDYLTDLGCNWLWFQPIHPTGIDGREPSGGYGSATPPYDPGSPYSVKNFFAVNELMSANYSGSNTLAQNRATAMTAWGEFVAAADAKGVGIMLDAPYNHTAFDVELAEQGVDLFEPDGSSWAASDEIRNREARFFSRDYDPANNPSGENYGDRATGAGDIAPGPDRFDFGKWQDVRDVYFGRYDALVEHDGASEINTYINEGDWFDFGDAEWTASDFTQGGTARNVTHRVWDYFAEYALHWLENTRPDGANRNSVPSDGDAAARAAWDAAGIDGLRCDFGQGLPPRAWEYMINVAREKKWGFVMMSESLDGGAVTYRSARHFDILNENIVFPLRAATNKFSYRDIFQSRRTAYGQALVLMNTSSHDEENYVDPWEAVVRTAVTATNDGLTMLFPGQELGISRTFGYQHYEINFGKQIAHFKRWNSMMPIWDDTDFGNDQLYNVYAGLLSARRENPALRASNRWFLDGDGGNDQIHAVAKYEETGSSPAFKNVVIAFANLDRDNDHSDNFKIPGSLVPLLGIKAGRLYNTRNTAAYNRPPAVTGRDQLWLWGAGIDGAALESTGFTVFLKRVPTTVGDWDNAPYEAQYLKLYDITPPPSPAPLSDHYQLGDEITFTWIPNGGPDDNITAYQVVVRDDNDNIVSSGTVVDGSHSYTFSGTFGSTYRATVTAVSVADVVSTSSASSGSGAPDPALPNSAVTLLAPTADADGDGANNTDEDTAGTNPLDAASRFVAQSIVADGSGHAITFTTVPGRYYHLQTRTDLTSGGTWTTVENDALASGDNMTLTHDGDATPRRFYRVLVSTDPLTPDA